MNFIPYGRQSIDEDDILAVNEVLRSDFLTTGPRAKEFEEALCKYCNAKYCIVVSNGTAALHLTSLALLRPNEKVLTTPNSFLATSNSILYARAKPVFVDIAEDGNIDLDLCEELLKKDSSIRVIYGVSFSGNLLDQEKLRSLKDRYEVIIVEDNAHALGAVSECIKAGSCKNSECSIFSFHPVKNITTGEGGAITTNSKEIYEKLMMIRNHGIIKTESMKPWEYEMKALGYNYRITDIQCALGLSQLKKLPKFIERRVKIAKRYDEVFENSPIKPLYTFNGKSSYHLYVVRVNFDEIELTKEELFLKMRKRNIGLQLHYMPINKQPYYRSLGYGDENTPVMDRYHKEAFSLPICPKMSDKEQEYVIDSLFEVLDV